MNKTNEADSVLSEPTPANGLIVHLTIDGTPFEDVEALITNPHKTIREQVNSIVKVFDIPRTDGCGYAITYLLGILRDDNEEPVILEFENEEGEEQTLSDYNIQPGDSILLTPVPAYACPVPKEMKNRWSLLAYACPVPAEMERKWEQNCLHKNNGSCKRA